MTFRHSVTAAALLLLGLAQPALAQSAAQPTGTSGRGGDAVTVVDVSRLPVDIRRIEREFRQTTIREERDGLNLRYFVEVYGRAPELVILTEQDNLFYGPVPYGAPTHREMLEMMTPKEYRAPAADFGNLFRWLADKARDRR